MCVGLLCRDCAWENLFFPSSPPTSFPMGCLTRKALTWQEVLLMVNDYMVWGWRNVFFLSLCLFVFVNAYTCEDHSARAQWYVWFRLMKNVCLVDTVQVAIAGACIIQLFHRRENAALEVILSHCAQLHAKISLHTVIIKYKTYTIKCLLSNLFFFTDINQQPDLHQCWGAVSLAFNTIFVV